MPYHVLARVARECRAGDNQLPGGKWTHCGYLPTKVKKALQKREAELVGPDEYVLTEGDATFVARDRKTLKSECGLTLATVDSWEARGLIEGINRLVRPYPKGAGKRAPRRRRFFLKKRLVELKSRPKDREPTELRQLAAEAFITVPEMESVDVTRQYARKYWDWPDPKRQGTTPAPPIGRVITTAPSTWLQGNGQPEILVRWGDIDGLLDARDNPKLLPGMIFVRDAVPQLNAMGIKVCETRVVGMIDGGVIEGGTVRRYRRDFQPYDARCVRWDDATREKIRNEVRSYTVPGGRGRIHWIGDDDYHPIAEASELTAQPAFYLYRHMPVEFGGFGEPCPDLSSRLIRCARGEIKNLGGDTLTVLSGDDLRNIAEALTGTRPKAPKAPSKPKNGNGHPAPQPAATEATVSPDQPTKAKSRPASESPAVRARMELALQAMLRLQAFDLDRRRTTDEIAEAAEDDGKADNFKRPMAALVREKKIERKEGREGGCWLTAAGLADARAIEARP